MDGKTVRGAYRPDGTQVHLLAAMTGTGQVIAQREADGKTNEITAFQPLLAPLDLRNTIVTFDALHSQTGHARFPVEDKGAHYIALIKANHPEQRLSSLEPTGLVNHTIGEVTGRIGGLDDSSIRAWRSGRVRCPKRVQLHALELISGLDASAPGFVRRTRLLPPPTGGPAASSCAAPPASTRRTRRNGR
ncbi:transposase [Streptomyces sp. NPDC006662]|uniref:transposase n=1 Tax=Streptomyces sp. NPDC006662 TaxID=3156902 RepID=UPI0033FE91B9